MREDHDPDAWSAAYAHAVRLLAGREHSRLELRRKLSRRNHPPALIEDLLDFLRERDLQNDDRFAENFVRSRLQRYQGEMKIRAQLAERGIEADDLRGWLPAGFDWEELAVASLRRGSVIRAADRRKWIEKAYRRLSSRGFSHQQAMKAARKLAPEGQVRR